MTNPYAPPSGDTPPTGGPSRPDHGRPPLGAGPNAHGEPGPSESAPQPPHLVGPSAPTPPPDPVAAARASRHILHFALLMLGSILVNSLPLPWKAFSLALVVAAMVVGIRAVIAVRRSRERGSLVPMLVIGLVVTGLFALTTLTTFATWPLQMTQQACLRDALTISAQDRCEQEFRDGLVDWQKQLQNRTDGQP